MGTRIGGGGGGGGRGAELFKCPYPPKVQARPPRDQKPTIRSKVSGQGGESGQVSQLGS